MDHDHLPALTFLLFSAPIVVVGIALVELAARSGSSIARTAIQRAGQASGRTQAVAVCLLMAGLIHLGLVPGHANEPLLAAAFLAAGVALVVLAGAAFTTVRWRIPAATVLGGVLVAYAVTRAMGYEGVDALGIASSAIELLALALVVRAPRSWRARPPACAFRYR